MNLKSLLQTNTERSFHAVKYNPCMFLWNFYKNQKNFGEIPHAMVTQSPQCHLRYTFLYVVRGAKRRGQTRLLDFFGHHAWEVVAAVRSNCKRHLRKSSNIIKKTRRKLTTCIKIPRKSLALTVCNPASPRHTCFWRFQEIHYIGAAVL